MENAQVQTGNLRSALVRSGISPPSIDLGLIDESDPAKIPAQLSHLKLEGRGALVTLSGHIAKALSAAKLASPTVFATIADPVDLGIVDSMTQRKANVTGITYDVGLEWKFVEHFKLAFPSVRRVGLLADRHFFDRTVMRDIARSSLDKLGIAVVPFIAESREDLERAFSDPRARTLDGWIVPETPVVFRNEARVLELVRAQRVPNLFGHPSMLQKGALTVFGVQFQGQWDEVASMLRKICFGIPAREIPVVRALHVFLGVSVTNSRADGIPIDPRFVKLATIVH